MNKEQTIQAKVNHLFREESGKMVSVLTKIFGTENYQLAEDVVQDALIKALETWKYKGLPNNPKAWLYRVAKNKTIDLIRKKKHTDYFDFSDTERKLLASEYTLSTTMEDFWQEDNMKDDFLGMMYACCHPKIAQEGQSAFILKSLCGFSTKEIAKAYISSEDTISKRIYRAKEFFRKEKIRPTIPHKDELENKTASVLSTIYMIFNEGYNATNSKNLIREDLIRQAISLCNSMLENEKTRIPQVYALMALMHYHAARTEGRLTNDGDIIVLAKQDRSKWDQDIIKLANDYLLKSSNTKKLSQYHVEAAIAREHCKAKTFNNTDWKAILAYYDILLKFDNNPIVALNRSSVVLRINGPEQALKELQSIKSEKLESYYLFHAVKGAIYQRLGKNAEAISSFKSAKKLTHSKQEQTLLEQKIAVLQN